MQVFTYLKIVVEADFKFQHYPTLKGKTAADVREAFVRQFERYHSERYLKVPYSCVAEKLYSIKPSSVHEERTMSVFTKMNTPARNRQHTCAHSGRYDSDSTMAYI
ncbi:hypothetical protein BDR04DRAFT_1100644, partial [Suillus decipiens]